MSAELRIDFKVIDDTPSEPPQPDPAAATVPAPAPPPAAPLPPAPSRSAPPPPPAKAGPAPAPVPPPDAPPPSRAAKPSVAPAPPPKQEAAPSPPAKAAAQQQSAPPRADAKAAQQQAAPSPPAKAAEIKAAAQALQDKHGSERAIAKAEQKQKDLEARLEKMGPEKRSGVEEAIRDNGRIIQELRARQEHAQESPARQDRDEGTAQQPPTAPDRVNEEPRSEAETAHARQVEQPPEKPPTVPADSAAARSKIAAEQDLENLREERTTAKSAAPDERPSEAAEQSPASAANAAEPERGQQKFAKLAPHIQEAMDQQNATAEKLGVADFIEESAARGDVAKRTAFLLEQGPLKGVPLGDDRAVDLVRSVRAKRSIPSQDDPREFKAWQDARNAKKDTRAESAAKQESNGAEPPPSKASDQPPSKPPNEPPLVASGGEEPERAPDFTGPAQGAEPAIRPIPLDAKNAFRFGQGTRRAGMYGKGALKGGVPVAEQPAVEPAKQAERPAIKEDSDWRNERGLAQPAKAEQAPSRSPPIESPAEAAERDQANERWHVTPNAAKIREEGFKAGEGGGIGGPLSGNGVSVWKDERTADKFLQQTSNLEGVRTSKTPLKDAEELTKTPLSATDKIAALWEKKRQRALTEQERAVVHVQSVNSPYIPAESFMHEEPARQFEKMSVSVQGGAKSRVSADDEELYAPEQVAPSPRGDAARSKIAAEQDGRHPADSRAENPPSKASDQPPSKPPNEPPRVAEMPEEPDDGAKRAQQAPDGDLAKEPPAAKPDIFNQEPKWVTQPERRFSKDQWEKIEPQDRALLVKTTGMLPPEGMEEEASPGKVGQPSLFPPAQGNPAYRDRRALMDWRNAKTDAKTEQEQLDFKSPEEAIAAERQRKDEDYAAREDRRRDKQEEKERERARQHQERDEDYAAKQDLREDRQLAKDESRQDKQDQREQDRRRKQQERDEDYVAKQETREERQSAKEEARQDKQAQRDDERRRKQQERDEDFAATRDARDGRQAAKEQARQEKEDQRAEDRRRQEQERADPYHQAQQQHEKDVFKEQVKAAHDEQYGPSKPPKSGVDAALDLAQQLRGTLGGVFGPLVGSTLDVVAAFRKLQPETKSALRIEAEERNAETKLAREHTTREEEHVPMAERVREALPVHTAEEVPFAKEAPETYETEPMAQRAGDTYDYAERMKDHAAEEAPAEKPAAKAETYATEPTPEAALYETAPMSENKGAVEMPAIVPPEAAVAPDTIPPPPAIAPPTVASEEEAAKDAKPSAKETVQRDAAPKVKDYAKDTRAPDDAAKKAEKATDSRSPRQSPPAEAPAAEAGGGAEEAAAAGGAEAGGGLAAAGAEAAAGAGLAGFAAAAAAPVAIMVAVGAAAKVAGDGLAAVATKSIDAVTSFATFKDGAERLDEFGASAKSAGETTLMLSGFLGPAGIAVGMLATVGGAAAQSISQLDRAVKDSAERLGQYNETLAMQNSLQQVAEQMRDIRRADQFGNATAGANAARFDMEQRLMDMTDKFVPFTMKASQDLFKLVSKIADILEPAVPVIITLLSGSWEAIKIGLNPLLTIIDILAWIKNKVWGATPASATTFQGAWEDFIANGFAGIGVGPDVNPGPSPGPAIGLP